MKAVARPFGRPLRTFRREARLDLIAGDTAIAIRIEAKDERARLLDELGVRDLDRKSVV